MNISSKLTPMALLLTFALALFSPVSVVEAQSNNVPGVVNINEATAEQLAMLPRVGPALSARILEFRKENGKFKQAEDLILVKGIGEKTFKNLDPFVVVEGKTTLSRKLRGSDVEAALAAQKKPSNDSGD